MITVAEYCDQRGITRQAVSKAVKAGKLKAITLPLFAEYNGHRLPAGNQMFVEPPGGPTLEMDDAERAQWLANRASTDPGIRADIKKIVLAPAQMRPALDAYYSQRPDWEQQEWAEAKHRLFELVKAEVYGVMDALSELKEGR